jgi:hypothetical protein
LDAAVACDSSGPETQRGGRHDPVAQHLAGGAAAQQVGVVDAVPTRRAVNAHLNSLRFTLRAFYLAVLALGMDLAFGDALAVFTGLPPGAGSAAVEDKTGVALRRSGR